MSRCANGHLFVLRSCTACQDRLPRHPKPSAMSEALLIAAYGGLPDDRESDDEEPGSDPADADTREGWPEFNGAFGEGRPIERW